MFPESAPTGAVLEDAAERTLELPAGGQDATELTLPVAPEGLKMVEARAKTFEEERRSFALPLDAVPPGATITRTLAPEQWQGRTGLAIDKQGAGTLYATLTFAFTLPAEKSLPMSKGITVRRLYHVTVEDPSLADTVASGADIEVEVEILADANYRYAILEAPIPAGCEVAPTEDESGRFARQEVRDDKVVFFFNDLPKGRTRLTYRLHAETPGVYCVLPGLASLIYFPEVRGNTGLVTTKIGERR